jgi:tRNA nucleotidyltransferase (CCA-adding enzyme)
MYTQRMHSDPAGSPPLVLEGVPDAVGWLLETLAAAGHASFLVGGCVRDLLRGQPPGDFDVATAADPQEVLRLFPQAVPIGLRHGTVMIPTQNGPIDVTTFRAGAAIEDDLAHRDFTLNAMAYDPRDQRLVDPFEGRSDLAKGRLRAVRDARDRFAEDPLRALRAARLAATLDLEVDPGIEQAMAGAVEGLRSVARERVRHELGATLLARGAARGLELLRRTAIEADLAPGAAADAPAVVAALPADLGLRLAAWLRGARATAILRRLRCPRRTVLRVERLLRWHPVEDGVTPSQDASVRHHLKHVGEANAAPLLLLRRAELRHGTEAGSEQAAAALQRVAELEAAIERVRQAGELALRRQELAIDGREVMRILGCGPGPAVGRALRYLTNEVVEDPARNTPEALRALLEAYPGVDEDARRH